MTQPAAAAQKPIRILIVDDSKVVRGVIGRILRDASPQVKIVGYAEDGVHALKALEVCEADIVILDLAMPAMDGITALPLILKKSPHTRVIVCSSLSSPGAEVSVKALALGATDCVPKPFGTKDSKAIAEFEVALKQAVLGLYEPPPVVVAPTVRINPADFLSFRPKVLAIGSSTGGPNALMALLKDLGPLPVPVIITQHMIESFTAILARQIQQETGIPCLEGREDMPLEPSKIYLAPGGSHMMLKRAGAQVAINLHDGPPENFCKPAVDAMLRSAVGLYGASVMAVILTGMGRDGLDGCEKVSKAGGRIIVQDQQSSIVWGMPGSVAKAGLANAILPLTGIAKIIRTSLAEPSPPAGAR